MTSKIKVDNINKVSDDSNIIKKCGTTTTIGSGASNPIVVDGSAVTLGRCGGTVALASGATQTGFGRSGSVNWQTTPKTATFTAADGEGYFINSGSAITMNLPAGSAGAIVAVSDYARNFATYNLTIAANGSEKIGGAIADAILDVDGQAATFVYVDSTKGWVNVQNAEDTETGSAFITATGGTITTVCTNFKVHTFTGPGTFCISAGGGNKAQVDYLVIAGGGGGGSCMGGGGGAGGYRESHGVPVSGCYTAAPTASAISLQMSPGPFSISVGGGGAGGPGSGARGTSGVNSTFSTITSAGGGGGGASGPNSGPTATNRALDGGSGGGQRAGFSTGPGPQPGAAGNTPPVSPPQGQPGGKGFDGQVSTTNGGGGGGSGAAGDDAVSPKGGNGGAGLTTSINASAVQRGAGGGGGSDSNSDGSGGAGGGGGAGAPTGTAGTVNTGSGAGGGSAPGNTGGAGGSGLVIIRYKFQ